METGIYTEYQEDFNDQTVELSHFLLDILLDNEGWESKHKNQNIRKYIVNALSSYNEFAISLVINIMYASLLRDPNSINSYINDKTYNSAILSLKKDLDEDTEGVFEFYNFGLGIVFTSNEDEGLLCFGKNHEDLQSFMNRSSKSIKKSKIEVSERLNPITNSNNNNEKFKK